MCLSRLVTAAILETTDVHIPSATDFIHDAELEAALSRAFARRLDHLTARVEAADKPVGRRETLVNIPAFCAGDFVATVNV